MYKFTKEQLTNLLYGTIQMFHEYEEEHGRSPEIAQLCAVGEMIEGLDAEQELFENGEIKKLTTQS